MGYKPKVNQNREFKEISADFSNPLDSIREAVSNSVDAKATNIKISAIIEKIDFQDKLVLMFEDNGVGMNREKIEAFFDLGNSKWDNMSIGEKGHGTKIFYRSESLEVETIDENGQRITARVDKPWITLNRNNELEIEISDPVSDNKDNHGTRIKITGFYDNKASFFEHKKIKDYILWFTAFGSIKKFFGKEIDVKLKFKGVDSQDFEELTAGHPFPQEITIEAIRERMKNENLKGNITDYFCKIWHEKRRKIVNSTIVEVELIFSIEGNETEVKKNLPKGANATDRYGLWVAKDYIPVERKNEWVSAFSKAIWTQFHIVVNCQKFNLTANRGSVGNSNQDIIDGVKEIVNEKFSELSEKDQEYKKWVELKDDEELEAKKQREYADLTKRLKKITKREKIDEIKDLTIFKPENEVETLHVLSNLIYAKKADRMKLPDIDFEILDIGPKIGIDLIVNWKDPATQSETNKIVEVEHKLENFTKHRHFFKQVHAIICWEKGRISPGTEIQDLEGNKYELKKSQTGQYFFQNIKDESDVKKVFVLSEIIKKV